MMRVKGVSTTDVERQYSSTPRCIERRWKYRLSEGGLIEARQLRGATPPIGTEEKP